MEKTGSYRPNQTMRETIRDNSMLLMAISRFDIAFGFGDKSISDVCADNGIDTNTLLAVFNLLSEKDFSHYSVALPSLMDYLKRAHSSFLNYTLPKIRHNLIDAINYSETNEIAFQLIKFYDDYVDEVKKHMDYENDVIFTYVDNLLRGAVYDDFNISRFSESHSHMVTKLRDLKNVFVCHYKQRDNARLSSVLFDIIMCEKDFMSHFEVERQLLFPEIKNLENSLRSSSHQPRPLTSDSYCDTDTSQDTLSKRERDIVACIAHGLANKEIADELCLSVHTVTTHRRNICAKLGIHSSAGLTVYAILHHLVELDDVTPRQ